MLRKYVKSALKYSGRERRYVGSGMFETPRPPASPTWKVDLPMPVYEQVRGGFQLLLQRTPERLGPSTLSHADFTVVGQIEELRRCVNGGVNQWRRRLRCEYGS